MNPFFVEAVNSQIGQALGWKTEADVMVTFAAFVLSWLAVGKWGFRGGLVIICLFIFIDYGYIL